MEKLKGHVPEKEIDCFDQILIKQSIEQALEIKNPNLTINLRSIVYIHNQLVRYGEHIFCNGFQASPNLLGKNNDLEPNDSAMNETVDGSM
jgi:hypothetical protein